MMRKTFPKFEIFVGFVPFEATNEDLQGHFTQILQKSLKNPKFEEWVSEAHHREEQFLTHVEVAELNRRLFTKYRILKLRSKTAYRVILATEPENLKINDSELVCLPYRHYREHLDAFRQFVDTYAPLSVYVTGIPLRIPLEDLRRFLRGFGQFRDLCVYKNSTNKIFLHFGYINMVNLDQKTAFLEKKKVKGENFVLTFKEIKEEEIRRYYDAKDTVFVKKKKKGAENGQKVKEKNLRKKDENGGNLGVSGGRLRESADEVRRRVNRRLEMDKIIREAVENAFRAGFGYGVSFGQFGQFGQFQTATGLNLGPGGYQGGFYQPGMGGWGLESGQMAPNFFEKNFDFKTAQREFVDKAINAARAIDSYVDPGYQQTLQNPPKLPPGGDNGRESSEPKNQESGATMERGGHQKQQTTPQRPQNHELVPHDAPEVPNLGGHRNERGEVNRESLAPGAESSGRKMVGPSINWGKTSSEGNGPRLKSSKMGLAWTAKEFDHSASRLRFNRGDYSKFWSPLPGKLG